MLSWPVWYFYHDTYPKFSLLHNTSATNVKLTTKSKTTLLENFSNLFERGGTCKKCSTGTLLFSILVVLKQTSVLQFKNNDIDWKVNRKQIALVV